jgi:hypothetical protein
MLGGKIAASKTEGKADMIFPNRCTDYEKQKGVITNRMYR